MRARPWIEHGAARHTRAGIRHPLLAATVACALLALAVLLGWPDAVRSSGACPGGGSVYVAAHEDDSFLYESPDLARDIAAGRCVETIVVTAGDAGLGSAYWHDRERGAEAAYAQIAGVADTWTSADAGVPGHPMPRLTLTAKPTVTLVFMRIVDGNMDGSGFAATGFQSLEKLWSGTSGSIGAVDGTSSYTRSGLIGALATLITAADPDRVGTQNFGGSFGDGDHSDHHATGRFTEAAGALDPVPHEMVAYVGYQMEDWLPNLSAADTAAKEAAWFAYAPYDTNACQSEAACLSAGHGTSWSRMYVADRYEQSPAPVASLGAPSPARATVGTSVTVAATGFAASHALALTLAGTAVPISSGGATDASGCATLTFALPALPSGPVAVTVSDGSGSASTSLTVTASVGDPAPSSGRVGTAVTLRASGFRASHALALAAGGSPVAPSSGGTTDARGSATVVVAIPPLPAGAHAITASDGESTASAGFAVVAAVANLDPSAGAPGTAVALDATGFAASRPLTVAVGGVAAAIAAGATTAGDGGSSVRFAIPRVPAGAHAVIVSDGANTATATTALTVRSDAAAPGLTVSLSCPPLALSGRSVTFTAAAPGGAAFTWDLDGTNRFATDTGETAATSRSFAAPGTYTISVRARAGASLAAASATIEVRPAPPSGAPGVSIDGGAYAASGVRVRLALVWPGFASGALISNEPGFSHATRTALAPSVRWTLREPRARVYVRFLGAGADERTFTDAIAIVRERPVLRRAALRGTAPGGYRVRIDARDRAAGIWAVAASATRRGGAVTRIADPRRRGIRHLSSVIAIRADARPRFVRVRNTAGTWSPWVQVS